MLFLVEWFAVWCWFCVAGSNDWLGLAWVVLWWRFGLARSCVCVVGWLFGLCLVGYLIARLLRVVCGFA